MPKNNFENLDNRGGTVIINNESEKYTVLPQLTKTIGSSKHFIGRTKELEEIESRLQTEKSLLINGIGGIGKSSLAMKFLHQQKQNYNHFGFIVALSDLKSALYNYLHINLRLKEYSETDKNFDEALRGLRALEGEKLLVIDDVQGIAKQTEAIEALLELSEYGYKILFTSREVIENIPQYFLDIMSVDDARELFLKHHATDEMEKVDKILEYLDYHTLFIEMTAKTLTKRKRTLSLDKMIEKFANGEFASIKKNRNESFNQFLNDLFANDKILQDEEILLFLKRLSVLPSIEISFEDLYKFLVCEDEERLEEFLIDLVDNGWLIESDGGYKFHQILKEFVLENYMPSFIEIETILDYFNNEIEDVEDIHKALKFREDIIYFESLERVLSFIKEKNEKVAHFLNSFGIIHYHLEEYSKVELLHLKALNIWEDVLGINHLNTAISYDNLGGLYRLMGDYTKSEIFHLKAIKIIKELLGENHVSTATSYDNLGKLYRSMGEYKKAEGFYLKAIKISIEILGEKHPHIATSLHNLAKLYDSIGEYEKAEILYLKAIEISKELLGDNHPDTAITYSNLASLYDLIGEYKKAEQFYLKGLNINIEVLGENHPKTIVGYMTLAAFYYKVGDLKKAYSLIKKSIGLHEKVLSENSSDLIVLKSFLELIESGL